MTELQQLGKHVIPAKALQCPDFAIETTYVCNRTDGRSMREASSRKFEEELERSEHDESRTENDYDLPDMIPRHGKPRSCFSGGFLVIVDGVDIKTHEPHPPSLDNHAFSVKQHQDQGKFENIDCQLSALLIE